MKKKSNDVSRRSDGEETFNRILHHAEKLFSIDGYTGVSLRKITGDAGVDLASIKYYFGSKEGLFDAVLARRVDRMSEKRLKGLAKIIICQNSEATIEELLRVFLMPMLGDTPDGVKELKNYRLLIALVTNSRKWQSVAFEAHYDPVAIKFIEALSCTLPTVPRERICWAFSFFLGSVVNAFAETGRVDRLSGGSCQSSDLETIFQELVSYSTGAFMQLPRAKQGLDQ
jgi:AcrR family transcriptional regulator